jgi:DHA2 family multidrug resistance protein-like MFS transporter
MASLDFSPHARCPDSGRPAPDLRRLALLGALTLSFACVPLDNTQLALAVPSLVRELGAGSSSAAAAVKWIVEANLVVYAGSMLLGGSLSERFGPRRMLVIGLCIFGAGLIASALAPSAWALGAARALVGAGAALMTPASLAAIEHGFGSRERSRAVAIWTAGFAAAGAIGPVLGGVLLERWGWRAAMLGNLPFVGLALVGVIALVPKALPRRLAPLDLPGTGLGLVACVGLLVTLLGGIGAPMRSVAFAIGLAALLGLWAWQRRAAHPMLDPELFRRPAFRLALAVILLGYLAFAGLSFAVAQYLQVVRVYAPSAAGVLNLPLPLAMLAGTLLAPRWMSRHGAERALCLSLGSALLGALLVGAAGWARSDLGLCLALVPFAAGAGSAFANATVMVLGTAPPERAGSAAAISETSFEIGTVLGIGLLGAPFVVPVGGAARVALPPGALSASAAGAAGALALALSFGVRFARGRRLGTATVPSP